MDYDDASKEQKNRPGNGFFRRQSGTERAKGIERGKTGGRILEGREGKKEGEKREGGINVQRITKNRVDLGRGREWRYKKKELVRWIVCKTDLKHRMRNIVERLLEGKNYRNKHDTNKEQEQDYYNFELEFQLILFDQM